MASPSINWDDFAKQASIYQDFLSETDEVERLPQLAHENDPEILPQLTTKVSVMEESPLLISKMAPPQNLVILSPGSPIDTDKEDLRHSSPTKNLSHKYNYWHKDIVVKTPLKNCTNIQNCNEKLANNEMITPKSSKNSEESSRLLCPSSAEFKEFLKSINEISPPQIDDIIEDNKQEVTKKYELAVTKEPVKGCPDFKFQGRKGSFDLDSPSCDLSVLCEPEDESVLHESEYSIKTISNTLIPSPYVNKSAKLNLNTIIPADNITNKNYNVLAFEKNREQLEMTGKGKQSKAEKSIDVQDDKAVTEKKRLLVASGCDLNADKSKLPKTQLLKKTSLRRPQFSSEKDTICYKAENLVKQKKFESSLLCSEEESSTTAGLESVESEIQNEVNESVISRKADKLQEQIVLPPVKDCDANEESLKIHLDGGNCEALSVSSLKVQALGSHKMLNNVQKQTFLQNKRLSTSQLGKASNEADPRTSNSHSKITPLTNQSLVKSEQLHASKTSRRPSTGLVRQSTVILKRQSAGLVRQSTVILKRQSTGLVQPKEYSSSQVVAQDQEAKSDAGMPPKEVVKPRTSLGHSITKGTSKTIPKLSLRPPSRTAEQSQRSLTYQPLTGKQRADMKLIGPNDAKTMQPNYALRKQDASKPLDTNLKRRTSMMKEISSASTVSNDTTTAIKRTQSGKDATKTVTREAGKRQLKAVVTRDESMIAVDKTIREALVVNTSKTVTREAGKRYTKADESRDESIAATNKVWPTKDSLVIDGLKTVTKEAVKGHSKTVALGDDSLAAVNNISPSQVSFVIDGSETVSTEGVKVSINLKESEAMPKITSEMNTKQGAKEDSRTVYREAVRRLTRTVETITVTNKTSPAKDSLVLDGSKTVTKEAKGYSKTVALRDNSLVSPPKTSFVIDGSKTVAKEAVKGSTYLKDSEAMPIMASSLLTEASKTVSRGAVKGLSRTYETETMISKTSPAKDSVVMDASKTVTKENKLADSRTVTRESQPAAAKTATKSSGEQSSVGFENYPGTPMIGGDKFLVPKRLSNVFHKTAALRGSVKEKNKKQGSSIPMYTGSNRNSSNSSQSSVSSGSSFKNPLFESPFPGVRSSGSWGDESDVFKPHQALVQHTPDLEPRRQSMWSPVKRNRLSGDDSSKDHPHCISDKSISAQIPSSVYPSACSY